MRYAVLCALVGSMMCGAVAMGQSPRTLYTWAGTGDVADWETEGNTNLATVENTTPGMLTITELGDELDPSIVGGTIIIRDGHNRRFESSTDQGGLDVTGLEAIEIDVMHNGASNVNVQFYLQATPDYNYLWVGNDGTLGGNDFSLTPNEVHTLRFPLALLDSAQQAYIRAIGLNVRDHADAGNVTWNISEMRSVGEPLTLRDLATHDTGSSDNGLNGAYANFEQNAIVGNDGGQNQTGLSHNPEGSGSLTWVDLGNGGVEGNPSGAAVTWGNGTVFNGNSFNARLTDLSNYNQVTFRVSATDALNGGGVLGIQQFYQTGNYNYQVSGVQELPIDGQYHDLVFGLTGVTNRENVQTIGLNLFSHRNDLVINVDNIRFETIAGLTGDYNANGVVDTADYTVWRDTLGSTADLQADGDGSGTIDAADYVVWKENFGMTSGGVGSAAGAVPEPATSWIALCALLSLIACGRRGVVAQSLVRGFAR